MAIMVTAIIMGHLANEYADFDTDSLTRRTLFSGGSGVLPSGIVPRSWALYGAVAFLVLSLSITVVSFAFSVVGQAVVGLVVVGIPLGWLYSMPPLRLERTRLGELDNALLGTMMFMIGYVSAVGRFDLEVLALSIPIFLVVLVNLIGVHYADRMADEMVGKRTMAVALGQKSITLFWMMLVALYASTAVMALVLPIAPVLACLMTLPIALWAARGFARDGGPRYGSLLMGSFVVFATIGFLVA